MTPGDTPWALPIAARRPSAPAPSPALQSRGVIVFVGLSYLFIAFAFSYLDRRFRGFGFESLLWLVWALLGFGAGAIHLKRPEGAGRTQWRVLGLLGFVLALFPGVALYAFPRWVCVALLIVMGARAATMRTRRDFYLTLTVVFAVSFMVATHYNADWSLWFYLGPAWLFGALALAWLHAEGVAISRATKLSMAIGFVGLSFLLASMLFLFAPRPPVLGFGFLPPGADVPGLFDKPAGDAGGAAGQSSRPDGGGAGPAQGGSEGGATPQPGGLAQQWGRMLDHMREAARDRSVPQWQRSVIQGAVGVAQGWLDRLASTHGTTRPAGGAGTGAGEGAGTLESPATTGAARRLSLLDLLLWVALFLVAVLLFRYRYRIGLAAALSVSWLLARPFPAQSMQLSARAMTWCLRVRGHPPLPGQSVREHWSSFEGAAPLAGQWLGYALECYCATRFGGVPATRQRALHMRQAVQGTCDLLMGAMPELGR
ncbi:hypothetical protein [Acidovorax sp. SUPP2539]|uniref:DUF3488 domain-containing protein n=1 Tax=Acidovorax sp. SUPP2539 TaxID=2920878 RepID=UPI0023DE5717|nr:hypothetical protein [Acidovorax sp. SUPP2539]GKS89072.1 DUF3488 domain-containing protein [Acidovorax sp. SUPP2539]